MPYFVHLNLRAGPRKIQKYYFLSIGSREHPEWRGVTHSNTGTPKVPFSAKMAKMPLVNSWLNESQTKSKSPQNISFHSSKSNPSFLDIFGNFDHVWPGVDSWWEILILTRSSELVETNIITKIIKLLVQKLFMGRNRS